MTPKTAAPRAPRRAAKAAPLAEGSAAITSAISESASLAEAEAATTDITFADLGLSAQMLEALTDAGYKKPTPIQAQAVPLALKGRDLIGLAQTGTGKTAAFTIPIIERLIGGPHRTGRSY